jgi:hypothetical protein
MASSLSPRFRLLGFALGTLTLLWFSVEDTGLGWVLGLALVDALWGSIWLAQRIQPGTSLPRWGLVGTAGGVSAPLLMMFFMFFKTGLHSHSTPDFNIDDFITAASFLPWLTSTGLLFGAAYGLWQRAQSAETH